MAMSDQNDDAVNLLSDEQQRYATWLNWGARSGLLMLIISFIAYVAGWLPAHVPLDQLPTVWGLPVDEYLKKTGAPTGWSWLKDLGQGDFASLIGIAWLSASSLFCLFAVLPIYLKRRDWVFVVLCISALAVQLLAASGLLVAGK